MKKINSIHLVGIFLYVSQICLAQNKYGFDFIHKKPNEVIKILKSKSFWEYNGEIDDVGIKDILIIKRGKAKLFDGYGNIKIKDSKIFEVVFYIDNIYKERIINYLKKIKKIERGTWVYNGASICLIEDEDLKKERKFGFIISYSRCSNK